MWPNERERGRKRWGVGMKELLPCAAATLQQCSSYPRSLTPPPANVWKLCNNVSSESRGPSARINKDRDDDVTEKDCGQHLWWFSFNCTPSCKREERASIDLIFLLLLFAILFFMFINSKYLPSQIDRILCVEGEKFWSSNCLRNGAQRYNIYQ